ncbi:hypothetical protein HZH68_007836 [Vespula germanica]|uniref:Uncharacterized protein n=1 Tax=Vespula germanica TaxID=30212 RepID=A0A834N8X4_VESGE|nr:hypothetical protein HZH68_007836 [Vespula germanica]
MEDKDLKFKSSITPINLRKGSTGSSVSKQAISTIPLSPAINYYPLVLLYRSLKRVATPTPTVTAAAAAAAAAVATSTATSSGRNTCYPRKSKFVTTSIFQST